MEKVDPCPRCGMPILWNKFHFHEIWEIRCMVGHFLGYSDWTVGNEAIQRGVFTRQRRERGIVRRSKWGA
jgi:hypothetical protein